MSNPAKTRLDDESALTNSAVRSFGAFEWAIIASSTRSTTASCWCSSSAWHIAAQIQRRDPHRNRSVSLHLVAPLLAPTSGKPCHSMECIGTQAEQSALAVATGTKTKNPENEGEFASFSGFVKIGATGLEPATSCTPCRRASQTAPRPEILSNQ